MNYLEIRDEFRKKKLDVIKSMNFYKQYDYLQRYKNNEDIKDKYIKELKKFLLDIFGWSQEQVNEFLGSDNRITRRIKSENYSQLYGLYSIHPLERAEGLTIERDVVKPMIREKLNKSI